MFFPSMFSFDWLGFANLGCHTRAYILIWMKTKFRRKQQSRSVDDDDDDGKWMWSRKKTLPKSKTITDYPCIYLDCMMCIHFVYMDANVRMKHEYIYYFFTIKMLFSGIKQKKIPFFMRRTKKYKKITRDDEEKKVVVITQ